jgi:hypothetical protein
MKKEKEPGIVQVKSCPAMAKKWYGLSDNFFKIPLAKPGNVGFI